MSEEPPIELRTHIEPHHDGSPPGSPPGPHDKRFDCFLIDSGWNEPVSKLVHSHLPQYFGPHNPDPLYILTCEQSVEILRREPLLIGHDPIVVVYDSYPPPQGKTRGKYRGFRLNLGLFRNPHQALARLQEFLQFLIVHRRSMQLEADVIKELHREGLHGMVKALRDVSEKSMELI